MLNLLKINSFFILTFLILTNAVKAQLPDSCKLEIGTNLGGLADWGTEIPFVDLMHMSRTWYTKSVGDPNDPFDSGFTGKLSYRDDGYPTHIPQTIDDSPYPQHVATIWAITDGWPAGQYTVLWEGDGELVFWGTYQNLHKTEDHRIVFDFPNPKGGVVELKITYSNINDPIHNIRVLMPGTENTYLQQPFYKLWTDKLSVFKTVRFMDWGQTNAWGLDAEDGFGDSTLVDWDGRSKYDYYTWTHGKGVPYEMMVKYMNDYDKDGWVCVPHSASKDYIRKMARFFRDNLEPDRHIYVEYSNEIWNWIFPQTQWANYYGCVLTGETWPEGTTKFIQRTMDIWTEEFEGQMDRLTRVVGVFTGWLDVAQRVAFNVDTNSFDAIAPTYYFHLSEDLESQLDDLGANAKVSDIARIARESMPEAFTGIKEVKYQLADVINKPLAFYEGGQHLTPQPFGVTPSYEQALLDIQRDTAMYNLYSEWFDQLRTLQDGDNPLLLMNFSFVSHRSAQYGSWGILETLDQDTSVVPAPKYKAIIENMNTNCQSCSVKNTLDTTVCDGLLWNGDFYTSSGIIKDTLMSSSGCDSIVIMNLKVKQKTFDTLQISTCEAYQWNNVNYDESGVYTDTLMNQYGCDSIVSIDLTITTIDTTVIDVSTTNEIITLKSNEDDAVYQWINCDTKELISGEINQTFEVKENGSYAVIITKNGCVDTSQCTIVTSIGTVDLFSDIKIYPNPNNGTFYLNLGSEKNIRIKLIDLDGKILYSKENINERIFEISADIKSGIYILEIDNNRSFMRYKLVVNP